MLIPIKLLEYMGFIGEESEESSETPSSKDLLEEHLKESILEVSTEHIDTDKATKGAQNIETLSKAYEHLEKAESERLRIELQIAEARKRDLVNWDVVIPKLAGIGIAGAVTIFWLCLEQNTPIPRHLVKLVSDLTVPRSI